MAESYKGAVTRILKKFSGLIFGEGKVRVPGDSDFDSIVNTLSKKARAAPRVIPDDRAILRRIYASAKLRKLPVDKDILNAVTGSEKTLTKAVRDHGLRGDEEWYKRVTRVERSLQKEASFGTTKDRMARASSTWERASAVHEKSATRATHAEKMKTWRATRVEKPSKGKEWVARAEKKLKKMPKTREAVRARVKAKVPSRVGRAGIAAKKAAQRMGKGIPGWQKKIAKYGIPIYALLMLSELASYYKSAGEIERGVETGTAQAKAQLEMQPSLEIEMLKAQMQQEEAGAQAMAQQAMQARSQAFAAGAPSLALEDLGPVGGGFRRAF